MHLINEFPGIRPIETPDDDRVQQRGIEVSQVHRVASAGLELNGLPVGGDATGPATEISQSAVAPDVALRILRMAAHGDRAKLVVGPNASRAPA